MTSKAKQLRDMARDCREMAAVSKNPEMRLRLSEIADSFDRLAEDLEPRKKPRPKVLF